jgi:hypothetical protein
MLLTAGAATFGAVPMAQIGQLAASPLEGGAPDYRRRFIFCYFNGGWDVLLGADPRDPREFTPERRGITQVDPAYARLTAAFSQGGTEGNGIFYDPARDLALGPAAGPVWAHRDKMCVVRGISMSTVTHEVGRRYFLTGRTPTGLTAKGSSIPTEIAAQLHGEGAPETMPFVPNLAYSVESYNDRHPSFASALKISSVEDLLDALRRPDLGYSDDEERLIADYLHRPESFGMSPDRLTDAINRSRRSELQAEAVLAAQLDRRLRFPTGLNLNSPTALGLLAVQAITQQISTTVSLRVTDSLDTHFNDWATDQPTRQMAGFEIIDLIIRNLKDTPYPDGSGRSWFDFTTVVAFSEFSRTPLINTREGRDHHPVNTCMMWGAGIPHGKVIGASTPYGMLTSPVDLRTGQVDPGGHVLRPEDILGTVMANAGLDASFLSRDVQYVPALEPQA